jgi:hypothetical protein
VLAFDKECLCHNARLPQDGDLFALDAPFENPALNRGTRIARCGIRHELSAANDCKSGTEHGDVFDDVCRQEHDAVLRHVAEKFIKTLPFFRVEARRGFVDDEQARIARDRLGDPEPLPHASRVGFYLSVRREGEMDALQKIVRDGAHASARPDALQS